MIERILHLFGIHHPFVHKHANQLFRFAMVGGAGSMIDIGGAALLVEIFSLYPPAAIIASSICAIIVVFLCNKHFTFRNREKAYAKQGAKFLVIYGISLSANIAIAWLLWSFGIHYLLAKIIAIGITALFNYTFSNIIVFR